MGCPDTGPDGDPEEPDLGTGEPVARLDDPRSSPVGEPWPLLALGDGEPLPGLGRPAGDHDPNRRGRRGARRPPCPGPGPAPGVAGGPHHREPHRSSFRWGPHRRPLGPDRRGHKTASTYPRPWPSTISRRRGASP